MRSQPEQVYALLVEANLVPDPDRVADFLAAQRPTLSVVPDVDGSVAQWAEPERPAPRSNWLRPALAGAAIALMAVLAVLLVRNALESDFVQPPTPEQEGLSRVEDWFYAVEEGRIDDLEAILGELSPEDHLMWEFNAVLADAYPRELGACEVTSSVASIVTVECLVSDSDPVFTATGTSELLMPFRYADGVVSWQTFRAADGLRSPFAGPAAYAEYLEAFLPEEFAPACSPASYTGPFVFNGYMVLAPPCADLMVAHAEDIAAWVEAGRPADWDS
jgi:hypothetical protein